MLESRNCKVVMCFTNQNSCKFFIPLHSFFIVFVLQNWIFKIHLSWQFPFWMKGKCFLQMCLKLMSWKIFLFRIRGCKVQYACLLKYVQIIWNWVTGNWICWSFLVLKVSSLCMICRVNNYIYAGKKQLLLS